MEEDRRGNQDSLARRMEEDSRNNNPGRPVKDSLPKRLEEEFQRQARPNNAWKQEGRPTSVRNTVNYLNQLSRGDPGNVRAKGPFISQITIRETPNES